MLAARETIRNRRLFRAGRTRAVCSSCELQRRLRSAVLMRLAGEVHRATTGEHSIRNVFADMFALGATNCLNRPEQRGGARIVFGAFGERNRCEENGSLGSC